MIMIGLLFLLLMAFIFFSFPISIALGIASVILLVLLDIPMSVGITIFYGGIDSFPLMAIPFFILAGEIMGKANVVEQIVNFADSLVGGLRGGLGHVNVVGSMIFAGISGSGAADASAIGSITIPSMIKQGYGKDLSVAVNSTAATIGPIIPPSIPMILWGTITGDSIGALFLGGVIPGFIIGFGLMALNYIVCKKRGYFFKKENFSVKRVIVTFFKSIGALIMPAIIIGGIITGVFTATEAGVVAVVYGFFFGLIVTRTLKLSHVPRLIVNAAETSGMCLFIVAMSMIFSHILTRLGFQEMVLKQILGFAHSPALATSLVILVLLFLGCFIDPTALVIMFSLTLSQLGKQLGYQPIHYGVLMIITMLIGAVTPPVGGFLFISLGIAKTSMDEVLGVLYPFISVLVVVLIIVLFIPQTVTWIPGLLLR
jgi:tripartite ATP-independent transporter DctM subunit